jgi:hypothetical protein
VLYKNVIIVCIKKKKKNCGRNLGRTKNDRVGRKPEPNKTKDRINSWRSMLILWHRATQWSMYGKHWCINALLSKFVFRGESLLWIVFFNVSRNMLLSSVVPFAWTSKSRVYGWDGHLDYNALGRCLVILEGEHNRSPSLKRSEPRPYEPLLWHRLLSSRHGTLFKFPRGAHEWTSPLRWFVYNAT